MKTEPGEYSIDQLELDGSSSWFGVRNYQARNFMRDSMKVGDAVLIYHSNCAVPGIVGLARVVSLPHDDETQFSKESPYYDARSSPEKPIWKCVDIGFVQRFSQILSLAEIRSIHALASMKILKRGNRLSITAVTIPEYEYIISYGSLVRQ